MARLLWMRIVFYIHMFLAPQKVFKLLFSYNAQQPKAVNL